MKYVLAVLKYILAFVAVVLGVVGILQGGDNHSLVGQLIGVVFVAGGVALAVLPLTRLSQRYEQLVVAMLLTLAIGSVVFLAPRCDRRVGDETDFPVFVLMGRVVCGAGTLVDGNGEEMP